MTADHAILAVIYTRRQIKQPRGKYFEERRFRSGVLDIAAVSTRLGVMEALACAHTPCYRLNKFAQRLSRVESKSTPEFFARRCRLRKPSPPPPPPPLCTNRRPLTHSKLNLPSFLGQYLNVITDLFDGENKFSSSATVNTAIFERGFTSEA